MTIWELFMNTYLFKVEAKKTKRKKKIGLGPIFAYYWREGDKGAGARTYCN